MIPIVLSLFIFSPFTVSALILKEVSVPPFIIAGEKCVMECHYDSQVGLITYSVTIFMTSVTKSVTSWQSLWQGEQVYSVKWYKGGLEIFRNLPSVKEQPITAFPRTGVIIDEVKLQNKLNVYWWYQTQSRPWDKSISGSQCHMTDGFMHNHLCRYQPQFRLSCSPSPASHSGLVDVTPCALHTVLIVVPFGLRNL